MVTSSAAVGSSATRRRGPPARARARSARWRIPPESWWGNAFLCRPGSGSDTRESQRSASTAAAFRERPRCRSITSASSRPIVRTGSSAVAGSWKTSPIPPPRRRSFSRAGSARTSRPAKKTSPETRRTGGGTRSTSASDVSVLPHPDSPTRATISPAPMSKETPSTAGTSSPDGPGTAIVRAWTERSGAAAPDTADLRRAGCVSSGRKLLEPLPDIAERGVRAVDLQERPVRVLAITEVGIEVRKVVLQAQAVFLANTGIVETLSVPLDRELREAFLQEAQSEHRAALHCVLRALRGSLELADGFVREGHLLVGDAEVVMRLVVLGRQLLLDALLELAEDLLQRDIAYKEMSLTDEAISEFQRAAKSPQYAVECCSMLGLCFLEKGLPQLAIKWYRKGLDNPGIREEDRLGLQYDLANLYADLGDRENAYRTFLEIYLS